MKLIIKKIYKARKHLITGIGNYLMGSISVYFMCELLKSSPLITLNKHHYDNCVKYLSDDDCWLDLSSSSIYNICDMLNYQENYKKFITNLICMLLVVYSLSYNISLKESYPFGIVYWVIAHGSAIIFSLLNNVPLFQFSLASGNKYSEKKLWLIAIIFILLLILIIRQARRKKGLRYAFLFFLISIHTFIYALFKTVLSTIPFHFHHSLCAGILSICFTDFSSKINLYIHSIMMGIVIQGINFYTINEIYLFSVSYIAPPSFQYMCFVFPIYFIIWISIISDMSIIKKKIQDCCCKPKESLMYEIPLLVPPLDNENNYYLDI